MVARFGAAHDVAMPAPSLASGVTGGSTTATGLTARTDAPTGNAGAGTTRPGHPETSPPDGEDVNPQGLPPLILAAQRADLDQLRTLLKQPRVDIDQVDTRFGSTALMFAVEAGNLDVVEFLLAMRADVNFRNPKTRNTALIAASIAGKLDVVNVLLKCPGIRLEQTNNIGVCALACAAQNGHADIVDRLIEAGASVALVNGAGQNCMQHAIANGHANVVECLLNHGVPLPNPLVKPAANTVHALSLSDLCLERIMPAASTDNPFCLLDPRLLDEPDRFFQALVAALNPNAGGSVNEVLANWLVAQGIRHSIVTPIMTSLGDLSQVWSVLAAPGQPSPTARQKLVYCASTLSRLGLLVSDQQIAAPYLQAKLSAGGMARLSQSAVAQRNKLVALAELATARLASEMLDQLATDCIAKTNSKLQTDDMTLKASMIDAGLVAPLAAMLVDSWRAALAQVRASPVTMPPLLSIDEMMAVITDRVATQGLKLFVQEILRRLDSADLLTQWRATLGDIEAEGLFALFDDQCRQLRQYCEQMGEHGA